MLNSLKNFRFAIFINQYIRKTTQKIFAKETDKVRELSQIYNIDYKTNLLPPQNNVFFYYLKQQELYTALMRRIFSLDSKFDHVSFESTRD